VLLVGTGTHLPGTGLPDVPAVASTLADLKRVLVSQCRVAPEAISVLSDASTAAEIGDAVLQAAGEATDLLVIYYVGHGVLNSRGVLHLAARSTIRTDNRMEYTGLPYPIVGRRVRESRATYRVVVLDCCFAGRALDELSGLGEADDAIADLAKVPGGFVLTSASRFETALAPAGARHTAFTGALLRLLQDGTPEGPAEFTLRYVHQHLARVLPESKLPQPRCRADNQIGELVVAPNRAHRPIVAPPTARLERIDLPAGRLICPYKGLAAFDVGDERWFFGRARLVAETVRQLAARYHDRARPLAVIGASGAGKSSVLRAGLVPAVARGDLDVAGSAAWPRFVLTPTEDPVRALALSVAGLVAKPAEALVRELRADPVALRVLLREGLDASMAEGASVPTRAVLVADQFEEVFTLCDDERDRRTFIGALCAAASGDRGTPSALVVFGMRSDFYGHCAAYPELAPLVYDSPVVVAAMGGVEVREAIEAPAWEAGLAVEPELVGLLLDDLGVRGPDWASGARRDGTVRSETTGAYEAGRLPLLSHALRMTWQEQRDGRLTVAGYRRTGGISRALANSADEIMAHFDESGRDIARRLLLQLVHIGETGDHARRRVDRGSLITGLPAEQAGPILDALSSDSARLVTVDNGMAEIVHEALIREWPALRSWIDHDRGALIVEQAVLESARAWEREGRDPALLYRGSRLALAQDWAASHQVGDNGSPTRAFLDASVRHELDQQRIARSRSRLRTALTASLAVLLVVATVAAGLAIGQARTEAEQRRRAVAQSLLAQAESLRDSQPATALRLRVAALSIDRRPEIRSNLVVALLASHYRATLASPVPISSADISGDGRTALTGGRDGTAVVWDIADPAMPRRLSVLSGQDTPVLSVALSPDAGTAITSNGLDGVPTVWDLADRSKPRELAALADRSAGGVSSVAFSPAGHTVLTGGQDGSATLWDLTDRSQPRQLAVLGGHGRAVFQMAFGPGSDIALVGARDGTADVWDLTAASRPRRLATLTGSDNTQSALSVAFDATGRTAVTGAGETVVLWDLTNRSQPRRLATSTGDASAVTLVGFDPDGHPVTAARDGSVTAWELAPQSKLRQRATFTDRASDAVAMAFSPGGRLVLTAGGTTGIVWQVPDRTQPRGVILTGHSSPVFLVAVGADGRTALTGGLDESAILWDIGDPAQPRRLATLSGLGKWGSVALSPDGRTAVTSGKDNTALVWDISEPVRPQRIAVLAGHTRDVGSVEFSPDGQLAVTVGDDLTAIVWDLTDRSRPRRLATLDHKRSLSEVAVDQHTVLIGAEDGTAMVWDITDRSRPRPVASLTGHDRQVRDVALSPDGRAALTGGNGAEITILWDLTDRSHPRRVANLSGHTGTVNSVAFGPRALVALTAGTDKTAIMWDLSDRGNPRRIATLHGHTQGISGLAISPDGRVAVTGAADKTAMVWDIAELTGIVVDPIKYACSITAGGLGAAEWRRYAPSQPYHDSCAT
jgi:WD40 repeat protein